MHTRLAGIEQAILHHLGWVVHVIKLALFTGGVHSKDGSSADASVNVGGAVQWVKDHNIVATVGLLHSHWLILFFTGNDTLQRQGGRVKGGEPGRVSQGDEQPSSRIDFAIYAS